MKIIDLLNKKANNELMPQLIKITWIDYEVEYYLDDDFWYRSIEDDKKLEIFSNILNVEVTVITNEYKQLIHKIIEEDKEIEELPIQQVRYQVFDVEFHTEKNRNIRDIVIDFNDQSRKMYKKINELIREVNKIKKEGK